MIESLNEWTAILTYNRQLLDQAVALVDEVDRHPQLLFSEHCGPHLRHLVEHYEALLKGVKATRSGRVHVAYDQRQRDRALERCPQRMRERLVGLQERVMGLTTVDPQRDCEVELCGGLEGAQTWRTRSTLVRELLFLSSHTTHHFALIRSLLGPLGPMSDPRFGKAPATVRHEQVDEQPA